MATDPDLQLRIQTQRGLIVGYHGCSQDTCAKLLDGKDFLKPSLNVEDWLGWGAYFWENDHFRALDWARERHSEKAAVVGCLINPGHCLSLIESADLELLAVEYKAISEDYAVISKALPENNVPDEAGRPRRRPLDCAVINSLNQRLKTKDKPTFDTVRAAFEEGDELYNGSSFKAKNHIQICVRNPRSIIGFFRVLGGEDYPTWELKPARR